jgi:hypothetical protein
MLFRVNISVAQLHADSVEEGDCVLLIVVGGVGEVGKIAEEVAVIVDSGGNPIDDFISFLLLLHGELP